MSVKGLAAAIIEFLTQQLEDGNITEESRESLEVAIQCLESAYNVQGFVVPTNFNLLEVYKKTVESTKAQPAKEAMPEEKAEAERLKNEGNAYMKAEKHQEAIASYTKAIELNGANAVYYCNRAAAYSKIGNHEQAISDCQAALTIDRTYSKAYGRLGLAYSSLNKLVDAGISYKRALEMEPDNESYKYNLHVTEERIREQSRGFNSFEDMIDIALSNPDFLRAFQRSTSSTTNTRFRSRTFGDIDATNGK
ncbi:small glutamine-rich tetratricopeptide repeat-containing protein alpha isoform X2 [Megalopta genalis]|uniref:small glutamine-rich tetratricopeptide repeat-containing protein alpha isoform X2 n=1 Tax=Megalopta genalis TaxID=115081 RepID=UPI0014432D80|nr:small glutamine-rich tetratricopeptide repeat-containing protein alpha-like isoform X2 [Megalopta genalis]